MVPGAAMPSRGLLIYLSSVGAKKWRFTIYKIHLYVVILNAPSISAGVMQQVMLACCLPQEEGDEG